MSQQPQNAEPQFSIKQLYVKDHSLEVPNAPEIFMELKENPELHMDLDIQNKNLPNDHYEITLRVTFTAKTKETVVFLIEVQQSGIFFMKNFSKEDMRRMCGIFCPNILYPYARQVITDSLMHANFPHI